MVHWWVKLLQNQHPADQRTCLMASSSRPCVHGVSLLAVPWYAYLLLYNCSATAAVSWADKECIQNLEWLQFIKKNVYLWASHQNNGYLTFMSCYAISKLHSSPCETVFVSTSSWIFVCIFAFVYWKNNLFAQYSISWTGQVVYHIKCVLSY